MIKELLNIELNNIPFKGIEIHIIKKYKVLTASDDIFESKNYSILLIKSGKFKIKFKDITQHLSAFDMLLIPRSSQCSVFDVREKLQLYLISFSSDFIFENGLKKEFIDSFRLLISSSIIKIKLDEKDFVVFSMIYKLIYFISKDFDSNKLESNLQRISFTLFLFELRLIYSKYIGELSVYFDRKENLVFQFISLIAIHCRKQHNSQFYAGSLFVTRGYLNKIVKEITGQNVKNLITQAILIEAKTMLEDMQLTIAFVAEELDFSSLSSFSNFFKRHNSISPSEYRSNTIDRFKSR